MDKVISKIKNSSFIEKMNNETDDMIAAFLANPPSFVASLNATIANFTNNTQNKIYAMGAQYTAIIA